MREVASISAALLAAEMGHLVLTTLHTRDASKTVQRIVAAFPQIDQEHMREQLAMAMEAVICQELLPRADGKSRVLATEILIATPAVRQLIRDNKLDAINDVIQAGMETGMISKDASIGHLYRKKLITRDSAMQHMRNPELIDRAIIPGV
ncbi:MAG: hypothetical protein A3J74_08800 [Elusimicrobia bacterium RIFCSPHIGHO2_02_FULL_57_9]|nr:MAG: hypothetical protein A3J74_08800 [Elusimicrobia bacterium RIFCSPHIGHO2_02_FULL_57_9]